jgi:hypothetical protein
MSWSAPVPPSTSHQAVFQVQGYTAQLVPHPCRVYVLAVELASNASVAVGCEGLPQQHTKGLDAPLEHALPTVMCNTAPLLVRLFEPSQCWLGAQPMLSNPLLEAHMVRNGKG